MLQLNCHEKKTTEKERRKRGTIKRKTQPEEWNKGECGGEFPCLWAGKERMTWRNECFIRGFGRRGNAKDHKPKKLKMDVLLAFWKVVLDGATSAP